MSQLDMATALEISLNDPLVEEKFQALKALHLQKNKSLMASIDNLQKEVDKLKILNKDNVRSQMIQGLKKKIRDLEFVSDVLKEELVSKECIRLNIVDDDTKKRESLKEKINEFIIRKTITGPKRFRPLTREEMENQIIELEKKLKRSQSDTKSVVSETKSVNSASGKSNAAGALPIAPQSQPKSRGPKSVSSNNDVGNPEDLTRIAQLTEEVKQLRITVESKEELVTQFKDEISRLRSRNIELRIVQENLTEKEIQFHEITEQNKRLTEELLEVTRNFHETNEECTQIKNEADIDIEHLKSEKSTLQEQCEKLLKQNSSMIKKITEFERKLLENSTITNPTSNPTNTSNLNDTKIILKLQEKLKVAEDRILSLSKDQEKLNQTRESLREKIKEIAELKKIQSEITRQKKLAQQDMDTDAGDDEDKDSKDTRPTTFNNKSLSKNKEDKKLTTVINSLLEYTVQLLQMTIQHGNIVSPTDALKSQLESFIKSSDEYTFNFEHITLLHHLFEVIDTHLSDFIDTPVIADKKNNR